MTASVAMLHYAGPPIIGGVEATIGYHARLLTERGHKVHVIAGRGQDFHSDVTFHHIPELNSQHPDVLAMGEALKRGSVPADFIPLRDRIISRLRPLLQQVDVLIAHNVLTLHKNMALTAALYHLRTAVRTPILAWCHDFAWLDHLYTPHLHPGYPWDLLRQPWDGVRYVVVSQDRQRQLAGLLNLPEEQIDVVYPGVDVADFLNIHPETWALYQRLNLHQADPLLLLPARITRRKNIELAVQVMAHLVREMPHATLLVTGPPGAHNPTNRAYLETLIRLREQHNLTDQVHFLYQQSGSKEPLLVSGVMLADLYRLADALFFPSLREGFGIPVLEAGLTRLPIFASDLPPIRESAGDLGHLFDPAGEPAQIAAEMAAFFRQDRIHRMKRRVLEHFTWQAIIEQQLIPLIEEVTHGQV